MVTLEGLRPLSSDMGKKGESRCKFIYKINNLKLDVFFFIDDIPFKLFLVAHEHNFSIERDVEIGFKIDPYIDRTAYYKLLELLKMGKGSGSSLKMTDFFLEFNSKIPSNMPLKVQPHEVPKFYYRDVEEEDKLFYCGSITWGENNPNGSVSLENLEKTKKLLGLEAYKLFSKYYISSKWTDNPKKRKDFKLNEFETF